MRFLRSLFVALTLTLTPTLAVAFDIPPNDGFVTDTAGILTQQEEQQLEQRLLAYQQQTTQEIAVVTFPTLQGESIADRAVEIGRAWGVGGGEDDNGVLLLISYEDHKIFLATGYGLEGKVPDIVARGIIEQEITPLFREGKYFDGIVAGVDALEKHIGGEYTADRYRQTTDGFGVFPWAFFLAFIVLNWFAAVFAKTTSWWLGGIVGGVLGILYTFVFSSWWSIPVLVAIGLLFDFLVSRGGGPRRPGGGRFGGWGGFGGGRTGGSGGFRGFGGGSFGGGGASGKW